VSNNTWVCIGSGSSLTAEDVQTCRDKGYKLATCNQGFKVAPDCDLFHALDDGWWERYGYQAMLALTNPKVKIYTGSLVGVGTLVSFGLNRKRPIHLEHALGGHNLIELVGRETPTKIILIGYDGTGQHFHDDYNTHGDISTHNDLYHSLKHLPVINCSRHSIIDAFPRMSLDNA
jgi:hypothetical protein